ncbi:Fe-S oxidoreductase [Streptomyces solincola]|uniref:Fe-S oxidoreductase n=1 Tax=Streptomyces solincola TaxID=2100817 RepID=A0A2S9PRT3_9ACTN|nr:(Fe-S)-binding protein [Streptomyces solincola]PRH77112.1 Fe-S oxidoreductase [Streptomyces solincola]
MRVALFVTCVNDAVYPSTGIAVVKLLERLGVAVDFPAGQTCCGQPQYNSGYREQARRLARRTAAAFADHRHVVVPSGSCAAMVRTHYARLGEAGLAPRVLELSEFLVDVLGVTDVGAYFPHRVAYHPSCHGLRLLGLGERPRRLLAAVRGLELVEQRGPEECCGFGGAFAVKNPDVSVAMGRDRVDAVREAGAEVLCGADNSCLMHLDGVARARTAGASAAAGPRTVHLAEILASTEEEPLR